MPGLFSRRTRRNRDARFERIAADANAVVVYARATADDAVRFLGISRDRILTLPYAPHSHPWWFDVDPIHARERHGVGPHYIIVCNHFWKHKDHATALRSFALLRADHPGLDLELVLTGDPVDHRDPAHYGRILSLSEQLKIGTKTHFLGLIPKRDQLALLRGSIALVQPTQFEGGPGGGSVYEAVGLGVPCVVSDIPVNLEVDQGHVRFFKTGNALDLAATLARVIETRPPTPDRESLLANGDVNLARLGNAICDYLVQIPGN